jgi:hypothetical protein
MRVLTELIGGAVLLLVFLYGARETIRFLSSLEKKNDDVRDKKPDADPPPGSP